VEAPDHPVPDHHAPPLVVHGVNWVKIANLIEILFGVEWHCHLSPLVLRY